MSEIIQYFQKCFRDYDKGASALQKNMRRDSGLPHNLVFLFQMENGLHGKKSENIKYLWHYSIDFLHSFTMFGKIMDY